MRICLEISHFDGNAMNEACSQCGTLDEGHGGWPDGDSGVLCQLCWEADCSRYWWEIVTTFSEAIWPECSL